MNWLKAVIVILVPVIGFSLTEYVSWLEVKAVVKKHNNEIKKIDKIERVICLMAIELVSDKKKIKEYCK